MKTKLLFFISLFFCGLTIKAQTDAIRLNQLGYYPKANKIAMAVYCPASTFEIIDLANNSIVFKGKLSEKTYWKEAGDSVKNIDFSALTKEGKYKIKIPQFGESHVFEISESAYRLASYASLKTFYYQRCSYELKPQFAGIWSRTAGHPCNVCIYHSDLGKTGTLSSQGGWYDAGDYGKYIVNAGISVASLLSFYENFPNFFGDGTINIPESGNGKNDLLDELKFELDWVKTMQDVDGGVFFKITTLSFPGFIMPDADKGDVYVVGKSTSSALDFAGMMAMAGRIYKKTDKKYADDCLEKAEKAWKWAKENPAIFFTNPKDVHTGGYGDRKLDDEFIWAASELFITTQKPEYKVYLEQHSTSLVYEEYPSWPNVQSLACLSLATQKNGLEKKVIANVKKSILDYANKLITEMNSSPCRIPTFKFEWGSNSSIANQSIAILYAYILTKDDKYIKAVAECADYLLGKNASGISFVSGYGSRAMMNPHHRISFADNIIQPIPGLLAGGPNGNKQDHEKYPFDEPAKCYVDVLGSYATNEVAINWNSPLTVLLAGVDAVLGNKGKTILPVVTGINNPPVLKIILPEYNAKNTINQSLEINIDATDDDGVAKIELYIDSKFSKTLITSPYKCSISDLSKGSHTITAVAFDSKGLAVGTTVLFQTE